MIREQQSFIKKILKNNKPVNLDIGCGPSKKKDYVGIDVLDLEEVDIVVDLERDPIPFPNDSVDKIYSSHFLEHMSEPTILLNEFNRVLKPDGELTIIVPHYTNPYAYHFTHKTYWSSFSLDQNYIDYYLDTNFELISKSVNIKYFNLLDPILNKIANASLRFYERILAGLLNAWEIEFVIKKTEKKKAKIQNFQLH